MTNHKLAVADSELLGVAACVGRGADSIALARYVRCIARAEIAAWEREQGKRITGSIARASAAVLERNDATFKAR